jgi:hypothetical protein
MASTRPAKAASNDVDMKFKLPRRAWNPQTLRAAVSGGNWVNAWGNREKSLAPPFA